MTMGDFIKTHRKNKGWTQEEFGLMFNPPVNRAAVSKWEKGHVTNIKRSQIEKMCALFNCKPYEIMCFDDKFDEKHISKEAAVLDSVSEVFGTNAFQLLELFTKLNELGKEKALEDLDDLTNLPKYTEAVQDGSR